MSNLFFYGTLRYRPLLELVLCEAGVSLDMVPAELPEHQVYGVQDQPFPMIMPAPGQSANGVLVRGLSTDQIERLNFYEGGFDYDLRPMTLRVSGGQTIEALVYFPREGTWTPGDIWNLEGWAQEWGELTLHAAAEVMAFYGRLTPVEIAANFRPIRIRAAARIAAAARAPDPDHDLTRDVVVEKHNRGYLNHFAMDDMVLRHRRYDGTMSDSLSRAGLMTGQASVILPYDPRRDQVLIVEQFRAPVYMIGDPAPWMWEAVAGMIDPGETPEQAALRELREEAHLEARALEPAGKAYSSSGSSTEFVHLFVALADIIKETSAGGLACEGEDIRSRILSFDALMALVDAQEIKDLPLLSLANWLARHRARLRG
ncbi:NUDIX domain-containing protein [Ruegeria aquimaris]|uniref:ADP-ribose pyrophosphatase n=1 Tax=Ruegeria aquimaris TaxID=2984333 RepID=A0ABT3ADW9_9RHOB|nr:NUDIX domain-containing protein [Ruegeria sp. XHP0148]MCV2886874.1 NUDIX domain-containing protein [Ruegeria sp. XHP0148]